MPVRVKKTRRIRKTGTAIRSDRAAVPAVVARHHSVFPAFTPLSFSIFAGSFSSPVANQKGWIAQFAAMRHKE
jgi:hypothetical protein